MIERLEGIQLRYQELERLMGTPEIAEDFLRLQELAKERASLEATVTIYREHCRISQEIQETQVLLKDTADAEIREMAKAEMEELEIKLVQVDLEMRHALLPADPRDGKNVIVEIRAGTGGDEAALFASDLYRMYSRYAEIHGLKMDIIDANHTSIGGIKEVVFSLDGKGVYSRLKYESGAHRVQRVPTTEANGRIHTSAATVAVMPEVEEVDIDIKQEDLRIDIFHAGGHGGQNVQKVATAVRITHIPTGLVATCQDERSQLRNKQKAMTVLRARLMDREVQRQQEQITTERRAKVGSGDRSEKIRTYNFPQNRVTDHRINLSLHNLERVMDGDLDALIEVLIQREHEEVLGKGTAG